MVAQADVQWVDKNDSVDNISLSDGFDLMGARPRLDAPPLSPCVRLRGQPTAAGQAFF